MKRALLCAIFLTVTILGCSPSQDSKAPANDKAGGAPLSATVEGIKKDISNLKDQAQQQADKATDALTKATDEEIQHVFSGLEEVAAEFGKHADELQGDSKAQYEKMRITYEEKKKVLEGKLAELKSSASDSKQDLLKDIYRALAEMKDALDHAAEAFRQSAAAAPAQKPS